MLIHGEHPTLAVLLKALYRDAVNATNPGVAMHLFPRQLKGSFCADLVDQAELLLSFQPPFEGRKHRLGPHSAFGFVALPQIFFRLLSPELNDEETGADGSSQFMALAFPLSCRPSLQGRYPASSLLRRLRLLPGSARTDSCPNRSRRFHMTPFLRSHPSHPQ
jgi:hypothetical protein